MREVRRRTCCDAPINEIHADDCRFHMPSTSRAKISGIAQSNAKKGDIVEVVVDLGVIDAQWVNALPDEPAHVALLRLEREHELLGEIRRKSREIALLEGQVKQLETALANARAVQYNHEEYLSDLASRTASAWFDQLAELLQRGRYDS